MSPYYYQEGTCGIPFRESTGKTTKEKYESPVNNKQ